MSLGLQLVTIGIVSFYRIVAAKLIRAGLLNPVIYRAMTPLLRVAKYDSVDEEIDTRLGAAVPGCLCDYSSK